MRTTTLDRPLRHLVLAAALLGPAVGGCIRGRGANVPRTVITFVNQSTDRTTLYAIGTSGESFRLGDAVPGGSQVLTLPPTLFRQSMTVTFVARPLATSRLATSGPVTIRAGDSFTVTLPSSQNSLIVLPGRR